MKTLLYVNRVNLHFSFPNIRQATSKKLNIAKKRAPIGRMSLKMINHLKINVL